MSDSSHTHALLSREGQRATVTITTEKGLNIASVEFLHAFADQIGEIEAAGDAIREVVIQATGSVFMAGADIRAMVNYDEEAGRELAELGHRVLDRLSALPAVTVAAIQGAAVGGGLELALACDFRVAVNTARLGLPEVTLGLIPGWGGTRRLFRMVPPAVARRMLFTGEPLGADHAASVGLIDELADAPESLAAYVDALLKRVGKAGPHAIAALKQALRGDEEINMFVRCFANDEARTGMQAFLDKEPAPWVPKAR